MKILFYAPMKAISDPVASGDREIARGLHGHFIAQGHQVEVLSDFTTRLFYQSPRRTLACVREWVPALRRAIAFKPDILFTYHMYYKTPDPFQPLLSKVLRKPYVIFEAAYSPKHGKKIAHLPGYLLGRAAFKAVAHVFTAMSQDYNGLRLLLPEHRISQVAPAINLDEFQNSKRERAAIRNKLGIKPDEILVSSVAMLRADRKTDGVLFLLDCLSDLKKEGLKFRFIHAGGGPCEEKVRAVCSKKLSRNGLLLGARTRPQVRELLQASDIFAFPGINEGFGMVFIEAQACGVPVVAFNNGGIPDAVGHKESGFLTPLLDHEAYKSALRKLITERSLRQKMGRAARARVVKKNDIRVNYARVERQMQNLIGGDHE